MGFVFNVTTTFSSAGWLPDSVQRVLISIHGSDLFGELFFPVVR